MQVKALQGKNVMDIVASDDFHRIMTAFWNSQKEDYGDAVKLVNQQVKAGINSRIPGHPIARLLDLSPAMMVQEYCEVLNGSNTRPAAERKYILQLGQQVYRNTIIEIGAREFPELLKYLEADADK